MKMTVSPGLLMGLRKQFIRRRTPSTHQPTPHTTQEPPKPSTFGSLLDEYKKLPSSLKNVLDRVIMGVLLLIGFCGVVYGGHLSMIGLIMFVQVLCYHEIITIAFTKYDLSDIPEIKHIQFLFYATSNFHFGCEHLLEHHRLFLEGIPIVDTILNYRKFVSFCAYFVGIVWFVISLKKKCYRKQFALLAWIHIILLVIVVQSYFATKLVFQGMIWMTLSILTVVINDVMAYFCGKTFGKTPLIKLSPKKTWEGFIGAAISSILITCTIAYFMCGYKYFYCPVKYTQRNNTISQIADCLPGEIFQLRTYSYLGVDFESYPFLLHAFVLSLFGSFLAPFGGFFASGFKRAFKVKDFSDTIPGHGGVTDRVDCILFMLTFAYVYVSTFITPSMVVEDGTHKMFDSIMSMRVADQLRLYHMIQDSLAGSGVIV